MAVDGVHAFRSFLSPLPDMQAALLQMWAYQKYSYVQGRMAENGPPHRNSSALCQSSEAERDNLRQQLHDAAKEMTN